MKTSGKAQWSYRFLPILLALFLVAGVVGLGLLVYTAAYAEDTDTPLTTGVRENETVTQAVYQELNEWEPTAGNHKEPLAAAVETAGPVVLEIEGEGVDNLLQFTMADLENMEQYRQLYSTINSWPTKKWYVAEGVKVRDLLDMAGINNEATLIKFLAGDGYNAIFMVEEIYGAQYLFPNFKEGGGDADGHIPGDPSGAIEVEPILALKSANSDNFEHMNTSNALHLIIGQRVVTEQTNEKYVKNVAKIEVLTDPVSKWEEPQASLPSGTVTPGTKIELSTSDMNGDKIYYTTDGSIPTIKSTMYNPIAKRWWSSRGPEAVAEINRPIEITEDTTIKAIAIGPGKEDSDVVEFTYTVADSPSIDVLYEGTVTLSPGETFTVTAYNSEAEYTVSETTPLGALQAAAVAGNFTYEVTDKNYASSGALLLDNVGSYTRKNPGYWYAYVNDVYKDGFNNPDGALNLIELFEGDRVEFYYAAGIDDPSDLTAVKAAAIAAVKTVASTGGTIPTDWTLQLSGAKNTSVTKAYFEEALSCRPTHRLSWTDEEGNVWGGMPLRLLVAMVDDDPDEGPDHFNFNDELAAQHYVVDLISGDGWKATLDSADIARNPDGYIVANTLNGEPLPLQTPSGKPCWPLHLKGQAVFGGQQVGNIVRIELSNLPEPPAGWTLELLGDVGDTITQQEFEGGLACEGSGHHKEWTDKDGNVWSGVPLWVLLGAVDDIETNSHWTFNDDVAAAGYTVKVVAGDGYSRTFESTNVARSDAYIIANKCNGEPLAGSSAPLRLVGSGVAKEDGSLGGSAVGNIVRIEILELQTPEAAPGSWNLTLTGKICDVISQAEFEEALACPDSGHFKEWTDKDGNVWSGIPLWLLAGWVDDRQPHAFNANQATAGYTILVKAGDGYTKDFASADVAWSNDYIVANICNGEPLTGNSAPLRLVGKGVAREDGSLSGISVGNIAEIELTSFGTVQPLPSVRIVKYAEDGTTILDEITVDYLWMEKESGFDVIGDGTTVYKFEGLTMNPDDLWDPDETYPGGFKIANAVKGTRIRDLCGLVGHMGAGTEIVFVAKDGFETKLPYSSIYPDPSVLARQGEAILAWWADGKYVPDYADGMRLFFTPGGDNVYGQWDMHETLPQKYWHYNYSDGVMYPSCAGLSAKWITEIRIYSIPQGDWTLKLDGRAIGGLEYDVSKTYFEQALACQFGAEHKATYTDSQGRVWEGMPLWFLVGFVDDADQHSDNAFNNALALAGYRVLLTADDGYTVTIDSADIIRNSNYIVANTLNGAPIPESDGDWPLRLVGPAVSGETSIGQIARIELISISGEEPYNMLSVEAEPADIPIGDSFTVSVNVENIHDVQGYQVTLKYDPAYAEYKSHRVNFKPVTIDLETIKDGEITVGNFVLGDTPWEQNSGALVEVEFESRHPGTIEGGVYAFTFEEIEVVLEPRDSSEPAVRAKLDSPVVKYYEGSEVNIYAALELREDHGGISSTLQNGSAYEATTASDGSATFETVRPGEYSLTLEAGGYLKAVVEGVVVTFGGENQVGTAGTPVKLYAGDVNGDGKINIIDISLAANKYGQAGVPGWVIEDLNLDGKVNISDLTAIARNFDMTTADTTYNYKDEAPYWE